jgi:hypothetical protein
MATKSYFVPLGFGIDRPLLCGVFVILFTLIPVSHAAAQICTQPPSGLVSWWPGDGNANDIVGPNNGTLHGDAAFATGFVTSGTGQAFSFDGLGDYVLVPDDASLDVGVGSSTFDAWIKRDTSPNSLEFVLTHGEGGDFPVRLLGINSSGRVDARIEGTGPQVSSTNDGATVIDGSFHHIAVVFDRSTNQMIRYVDGAQTGTIDILASVTGSTDTARPFQIASALSSGVQGFFFGGLIDEIEVFNRALSASEIQAIFNAGSAGKCKAAVLSCAGFEPPMDGGLVKVKRNRVLPHKAQLLDEMGSPLNDLDITAAPVVQVTFEVGTPEALDVTGDALAAGAGMEGNQFEFLDSKWHFNLKTKNYSAPGMYTITMDSGDDAEYLIDPTCEATFVID